MNESSEMGCITLIPSVHVSSKRIDAIKQELRQLDPDIIAVELDERRFNSLVNNRPRGMKGLFGAYKTMSPAAATAYTTLGLVQLAMARYTGVTEGSDMVVSITVARSLGCPVALIDKNIQPIIEDIVSTALDASIPDAFRWLSQNVEKRPRASALTELLDSDTVDMNSIDRAMMEFRSVAPYASSRLLDERNEYMATRLWSLKQQGYSVAAVVGAGHVSGMQNLLDEYELNPPAGAVSVPLRVPDVS